jgi:transcriptional regulator with XRE-family HTH domain
LFLEDIKGWKPKNIFCFPKVISILRLNQLDMNYAGKNFKYLRKQKGWTQDEFATRLGIKRSLVGAYEEERADPRLDVVETVCSIFKLSLEDVMLQDLSDSGESYLAKRRRLKTGSERSNIQFVPVKAAAGYLAGYNDPEFVDELNTFTLPMLATGNYRAFEIVGDSMLPTPSGSIIVGEKVESLDYIKPNQTYIVVSHSDGIVYKRIHKAGKTKGSYSLVSDNPQYPPYNVSASDLAEIWQAQMIISRPPEKPVWNVDQLSNVVNSLQEQVTTLKRQMG